jgi:MFS family permease
MLIFLVARAIVLTCLAIAAWRWGQRRGAVPGRPRAVAAGTGLLLAFAGAAQHLAVRGGSPWALAVGRAYVDIGGGVTPACLGALVLAAIVAASPERTVRLGVLRLVAAMAALLLAAAAFGSLAWLLRPATMANTPGTDGLIRQSTAVTCGPASGAMLLARAGIVASEGQVALAADCSPLIGTEIPTLAHGLDRLARPHGRRCECGTLTYDRLVALDRPAVISIYLAHLRLWHAVLVERAGPDGVELADPLGGQRERVGRAELTAEWDPLGVWME